MKKICLIGDLEGSSKEKLVKLIEEGGKSSCTEETIRGALRSGCPNLKDISALVFGCEYLDKLELACVLMLSARTEGAPILIVARQIALETYRKIDRLHNTVALQMEFSPEIFKGLLDRISGGSEYKPKICPRFVTNEEVRVLNLESGLMIHSRMRNYSSGGLFIEYRGISFKVGDRVQVSVPGPNGREHLQLQTRVVWERQFDNTRSPARGVGLQFIDPVAAISA